MIFLITIFLNDKKEMILLIVGNSDVKMGISLAEIQTAWVYELLAS